MPIIPASACAKAILFGEHAVVYDEPAIALPVSNLRVKATIEPGIGLEPGTVQIKIPGLGLDADLQSLSSEHPVAISIQATLNCLGIHEQPSFRLRLTNNFPFGAGLGGSAAIAVAIARSLSSFLGHPLTQPEVNEVAFASERSAHGKPSGIDNAVISLEKPIYFRRGDTPEPLKPGGLFSFLIADTGISKHTQDVVGDIALKRAEDDEIRELMQTIGAISKEGRIAFTKANTSKLGSLMNENQILLEKLEVSLPQLNKLSEAARSAGALGAKLTGGGRGGCILALIEAGQQVTVEGALTDAGARQIFYFEIGPDCA